MRKEEDAWLLVGKNNNNAREEGGGNGWPHIQFRNKLKSGIPATYLHEGKFSALESIDERLPRGTGAERGTAQQNANMCLPLHVDGGVDRGLLGGVECRVTKEDTEGITEAGGEGKGGGIGGVSKMVLSNDGRRLPTESGGEDLGNGYFSCNNESLGQTGRCRDGRRSVDGCLERIGLGMGRVVYFPLGRGRFGILFRFVLRAVGRDDR